MTRTPDASASDDALHARLLALLRTGDTDAALQAGLMDYPASPAPADAPIRAAQERLRTAWDARERHRARDARLARQAAERTTRRTAAMARHADGAASAAATQAPAAATTSGAPTAAPATPALPPAAAAALARARARAAGKPLA